MGNPASDNLFIGDIPPEWTKSEFEQVFGSYGTVVESRILPPKQEGQKGAALCRMGSVEEATWLVENLNGNIAEGMTEPIIIRFANAKGGESGGSNGSSPYPSGNAGKGTGKSWNGGKAAKSWKGGEAAPPNSFQALYQAIQKAGLFSKQTVPLACQVY